MYDNQATYSRREFNAGLGAVLKALAVGAGIEAISGLSGCKDNSENVGPTDEKSEGVSPKKDQEKTATLENVLNSGQVFDFAAHQTRDLGTKDIREIMELWDNGITNGDLIYSHNNRGSALLGFKDNEKNIAEVSGGYEQKLTQYKVDALQFSDDKCFGLREGKTYCIRTRGRKSYALIQIIEMNKKHIKFKYKVCKYETSDEFNIDESTDKNSKEDKIKKLVSRYFELGKNNLEDTLPLLNGSAKDRARYLIKEKVIPDYLTGEYEILGVEEKGWCYVEVRTKYQRKLRGNKVIKKDNLFRLFIDEKDGKLFIVEISLEGKFKK